MGGGDPCRTRGRVQSWKGPEGQTRGVEAAGLRGWDGDVLSLFPFLQRAHCHAPYTDVLCSEAPSWRWDWATGKATQDAWGTHRPLSRPTPHTRMLTMGWAWSTLRSMGSTRLSMSFSRTRYMSFPCDSTRRPLTSCTKPRILRTTVATKGCQFSGQNIAPWVWNLFFKGEISSPDSNIYKSFIFPSHAQFLSPPNPLKCVPSLLSNWLSFLIIYTLNLYSKKIG